MRKFAAAAYFYAAAMCPANQAILTSREFCPGKYAG